MLHDLTSRFHVNWDISRPIKWTRAMLPWKDLQGSFLTLATKDLHENKPVRIGTGLRPWSGTRRGETNDWVSTWRTSSKSQSESGEKRIAYMQLIPGATSPCSPGNRPTAPNTQTHTQSHTNTEHRHKHTSLASTETLKDTYIPKVTVHCSHSLWDNVLSLCPNASDTVKI